MPSPLEERRPAITPQLAVRVAILGGFAFVLFAMIFFRLWFLQVLTGDEYVSQAAQNRVRNIRIDAPRGDIVDRSGANTLVTTRLAQVVQLLPGELPESEREIAAEYGKQLSAAERERVAAGERARAIARVRRREKRRYTKEERVERRRLLKAFDKARPVKIPPLPQDPKLRDLYRKLGRVIGYTQTQIHRRVIQQVALTPYAAVTVKTDIEPAEYTHLKERAKQFPGVRVSKLYLRQYPFDDVAAHLFGTIGEVAPEELKEDKYRGVVQGERVGKSGVEFAYDRYLRGKSGFRRQVVDALGQACDDPQRCPERITKPLQGYKLKLTIDMDLQRSAQAALSRASGGKPGAFVAMDPTNGEILALGSVPSFDANAFAKPISQEKYDALNSEAAGKPLYNRAIAGVYPTGSTFKLVTATAALEEGLVEPTTTIDDPGFFEFGTGRYENAKDVVNGPIALPRALQVSSDVYFYKLGARMNERGPVLQAWAKRLGLGKATDIEIPGEFGGLVPDADWRNTEYRKYLRCTKREKVPAGTTAALLKCGGYERGWSAGDNVNLSVGQGDLQATPLQMAVAYSTLANGGTVVKPHLGRRVEDAQGHIIAKLDQAPRRKIEIEDATRTAILDGLRRAAMEDGGTSAHIFGDFPMTVYGKTGTVERPPFEDQSWYAAYVNAQNRPIVVVTTIERGGFGADAAAPAACQMLKTWYDLGTKPCTATAPQDPKIPE
jgi:penicillin-binding protein 2